MVLDGTSFKSIEFRPIGVIPVWFPPAFIEPASFYIKTTVYENEQINRHQIISFQGNDKRLFPTTIVKERHLFSIVVFARNYQA
ncbi:MAG: hypothetical protein ABI441_02220 [Flavobacterium sp.]